MFYIRVFNRSQRRFAAWQAKRMRAVVLSWLRTDGVNTDGAAAKVVTFDRLGKKVSPGTFYEIKVG